MYEKNKIVRGTVSGITEYGIFVKLDDYYSGLVHISEISDKFVSNINDYVKIGDNIKVLILDVDDETCHLKLSIKSLNYKKNNRNHPIIETTHKFSTLEKKLDFWIDDYLEKKRVKKASS